MDAQFFNFQGTKRFIVIVADGQTAPLGYQKLTINNQAQASSLVSEISLNLKQDPNALQYAFNDLLGKPNVERLNARTVAPKLTQAIGKQKLSVYVKNNTKKHSGTETATLAPQSAASSQNSQTVNPSNQGRQTQAVAQQGGSQNTTATEIQIKDQTLRSDPVSMLTGEEILPLVDFELSGLMQITWQRLYRSSKSHIKTSLGFGWRHCFSLNLVEKYTPAPKVGPKLPGKYFLELTDEEGRVHTFDQVKLGQTSYQVSSGWALQYQSLDQHVLVKPDESHWTFRKVNDQWLLESIIDFKGCYIGLYYDEQHRLARITCSPTRGILLQYKGDKLDNIKSYVLNEKGKREVNPNALVKYQYNGAEQLISCIDSNEKTEHYQYTKNNLLLKRTRASGFSHHFKWQGHDQQAKCIAQWGDDNIYNYRFEYHQTHTCSIDSRGAKESFYHTEAGLLSKYIDALGNQSEYFYNDLGQKTKECLANGAQTNFEYNDNGQLISHTDPEGAKTQFGYNQFGQRILTINALGERFSKRFDATGRLLEQVYPDGRTHSYQYNDTGLITEEIDTKNIITRYHRGSSGEVLAKQVGELLTRYSYDLHGRLIGLLTSKGLLTQFVRNNKGLITSKSQEFLNSDQAKRTDHYYYDNAGRLISLEDASGALTQYEFDGLAQPAAKILPDGSWLAYHYDQERNLTGIDRSDGNKYQIEYDANENPIKLTGFDGREQVFSFNENNKLISATDNAQRHIKLIRDLNDRVISQQHSVINEHHTLSHQNQYQYDKLGRVTKAFNGERTVKFDYHKNGALSHCEQGFWQLKYQFNELGQRTQLNLPDGQQIIYQYDKHGRISQINLTDKTLINYQYDKTDQLISAQLGNGIVLSQQFDEYNRLSEQKWQKHQTIFKQRNYQYDSLNRLTKLAEYKENDEQLNHAFNYNNLHQLICHDKTHNDDNSNSELHYQSKSLNNFDTTFDKAFDTTFDNNTADTTVDVTNKQIKKQYCWDAFGNPSNTDSLKHALRPKADKFTEQSNASITEVEKDRLKQYQGVDYFYDGSGNQTRAWGNSLDQNRVFDGLNQLRQITHNNQLTQYEYDALGRRSAKITESKRTDFIWDGDQLIGESTNGEFIWYVYIPDTFEPVALIKNGQIFYYHLDQLSTPQYLTNEQAQLVWQNQTDAFGKEVKAAKENNAFENSFAQPIRFQGQYFDTESGLHYNRYRYYCTKQQRFIHQDPIGLVGGINHYQYAPNPVNWVDPLGLSCKETSDEEHDAWLKKMAEEQGIKPVAVLPVEWLVEGIADAANAIGNMFDTGISAQGAALTAVALIPGKAADKVLEPVIKKLDDAAEMAKSTAIQGAKKVTREITETFGSNSALWKVDEKGRPISVEAKLDTTYHDARSSTEKKLQGEVGGAARLADDDGGHLIGHRFMSDQGGKNLFPQNANFNRGSYKKMENEWADWTAEGYEVKLKVSLDPPGADRPVNIISKYEVTDPNTGRVVYKKRNKFNNSVGQSFDRISKKDMKKFRG